MKLHSKYFEKAYELTGFVNEIKIRKECIQSIIKYGNNLFVLFWWE